MLSYLDLCRLVDTGVIAPVERSAINASSIDIHLGEWIVIEKENPNAKAIVDPHLRTNFPQRIVSLEEIGGHYDLAPGEFVLAQSVETFSLPLNISAEFRLKSSGARSGLNNLFACHCDAGWHGSALTLELHNVLRYTSIRLTAGMRIGQMLFHEHKMVPANRSYAVRGRYNNDTSVQGVKK